MGWGLRICCSRNSEGSLGLYFHKITFPRSLRAPPALKLRSRSCTPSLGFSDHSWGMKEILIPASVYLCVSVVITLHWDGVSPCRQPPPGCPLPSAGPGRERAMTEMVAEQGASVVQIVTQQCRAWRDVSGAGGLSCTPLAWIPELMPWVGCMGESSCMGIRRSGWDHRKDWEPWSTAEGTPEGLRPQPVC